MKPFDRRSFLATLSCSLATIATESFSPVRGLLAEESKNDPGCWLDVSRRRPRSLCPLGREARQLGREAQLLDGWSRANLGWRQPGMGVGFVGQRLLVLEHRERRRSYVERLPRITV